jgi:hypothetical protein
LHPLPPRLPKLLIHQTAVKKATITTIKKRRMYVIPETPETHRARKKASKIQNTTWPPPKQKRVAAGRHTQILYNASGPQCRIQKSKKKAHRPLRLAVVER